MAHFTLPKKDIISQYQTIENHVDVVSYSSKTNYDVVPLLKDTEAHYSIHRQSALEYVDRKGKVMYFPQGWTVHDAQNIYNQGVYTFILDNQPDIDVLEKWLEHADVDINVLLRLRLKERSIRTGKHYVYGLYSDELQKRMESLLQHDQITQIGIHAHRKSQNVSEWRLLDAFTDAIDKKWYDHIDIISMGGGIPLQYKNYSRDNTSYIFSQIDDLHTWTKNHDVTLVAEPGRFIAGVGSLHTTIINKYKTNLIVDCSVFNAAMDTFVLNTRLEVKGEREEGTPYTIKGNTPDSLDIFRYKVFLDNPGVGDTITFKNATAYNYSSDFCDLPKLETKIV